MMIKCDYSLRLKVFFFDNVIFRLLSNKFISWVETQLPVWLFLSKRLQALSLTTTTVPATLLTVTLFDWWGLPLCCLQEMM